MDGFHCSLPLGSPTHYHDEQHYHYISKKFILHPIHLMHQMQGMHKRQTDVQDAKCKTSCVLTSSRRGYMKPLRPVLLPRLFFAS